MRRIDGENILTGTCRHRGRTFYRCTESAHDATAIRLLLHRKFHLINGSVQSVDLSCIGECCTPLASTGLGGHISDALLLTIIALGDSGVYFMRS